MKAIKMAVCVLIIFIFALLLWMNFTPGSFRKECTCGDVYYLTDKDQERNNKICSIAGVPLCPKTKLQEIIRTVKDPLLLNLAKIDFYK